MTARPRIEVRTSRREVRTLDELLGQWLAEGVISEEQADRMRAGAARPTSSPGRGAPVVVEAVAYVGGALALAGCGLLTAHYWDDLSSAARCALVAAVAVLLLAGGAAVPPRLAGAGRRLRSVLWLASTAAFAGAAALVVRDVLDLGAGAEAQAVLVAAATTGYAAVLWVALPYGVQQTAFMVSAATLAGSLVAWSGADVEPGLGVWAVGLTWAGCGVARLLMPPETPLVLGAVTATFGAMTTATTDGGLALTLVTVAGTVALAVARRDLLLLAVGSLATLVNLPAVLARWFAGSAAAALVVVAAGAALVALSAWLARRVWR